MTPDRQALRTAGGRPMPAAAARRMPPPRSNDIRAPAARCACGGGCPRCGGAAALPAAVRAPLESRLGGSFGAVRVHADAAGARVAAAAGARAVTVGEDVYFADGMYAPQTFAGRTRIAHELVHVEQQRAGAAGMATAPPGEAEREARDLASAVMRGDRARPRVAAPAAPQHDGPESEGSLGPMFTPSPEYQLQLDPEVERLMLQQYIRWWLGTTLIEGDAPSSLPQPGAEGEYAAPPPTVTGLPAASVLFPPLPMSPDFFAPLPPDPLWVPPDYGAVFGAHNERGVPLGSRDTDAVLNIYRSNLAIAQTMPDLRGMAPGPIRSLIPTTWRRDIAGALTSAAVGAYLNRDYMTPIEVSDRAWQGMTGASTTIIPFPSISFDLF